MNADAASRSFLAGFGIAGAILVAGVYGLAGDPFGGRTAASAFAHGSGAVEATATGAPTRGITTDQRIDLPLDPEHAEVPKPVRPLQPVRLAVVGDDKAALAGIVPHVAPFEIVPASQHPDLVWDGKTPDGRGNLVYRDEVVAVGIAGEDLPAAVDRLALVRGLRELVQRAAQPLKLSPEERQFRTGQSVDVQVGDVGGRGVAVFGVAGDGTVALLYPTKTEPALATGDVSFEVEVGEPFGTDQIVAISASKPLDDFIASLRRLDRRKAAGEVLGLIDRFQPGEIKVGTTGVSTQP